jgi:hypothetical protein
MLFLRLEGRKIWSQCDHINWLSSLRLKSPTSMILYLTILTGRNLVYIYCFMYRHLRILLLTIFPVNKID